MIDDINLEIFLKNPLNADKYKKNTENLFQIFMLIHGLILTNLFFLL